MVSFNFLFLQVNGSEERMMLLNNTDTLKRTSASLHRAQQVSAHTSEMATNIMDDLGQQKLTLVKSRNRVCLVVTCKTSI